jgi:thiosulfate reductase cytochrome b subunit
VNTVIAVLLEITQDTVGSSQDTPLCLSASLGSFQRLRIVHFVMYDIALV